MSPQDPPGLIGVVLAGGASRRMGQDKGSIRLAGRTLVERALDLLAPFCSQAVVAVRPGQEEAGPYAGLPTILDVAGVRGPAAALISAWNRFPDFALLVLAVDLPLVDAGVLAEIVERRDPTRIATAFRNADGIIEPLCTIWEPVARAEIVIGAERGSMSLRGLLDRSDWAVRTVAPAEPGKLVSVNTPDALEKARRAMEVSS